MNVRGVEERLRARLLGPGAPELGCDECFDRIDSYVELELRGLDPEQAAPGMEAHLRGCAACAEDHDSLRALLLAQAGPRSGASGR